MIIQYYSYDHSILVRKLHNQCNLPTSIVNWIIDFYQTDPSRVSHMQAIANRVIEWSHEDRVQLNANQFKELRISFAKEQRVFDPIVKEGKEVELVTS